MPGEKLMPEPISLLLLFVLAVINVGAAKICWDYIPKAKNIDQKIRAIIGVVATTISFFVCTLIIAAYFII